MCEHSTTNTFNGIRNIYVDYRRRKHAPHFPGQVIPHWRSGAFLLSLASDEVPGRGVSKQSAKSFHDYMTPHIHKLHIMHNG